jgi:predicted GNAT family acetyltransferase
MKFGQYIINEDLKFKEKKFDGMFTPIHFDHGTIHYRIKRFDNINSGDRIYELHLGVEEKFRGQGYAAEMMKSFLKKKQGVAYIAFGRIINPAIHGVINKIDRDPDWSVEKLQDGYLIKEV